MLTMAKIVGDLIQGYSMKIACVVGAVVVGSEVKDFLGHALDPVSKILGGS